MLHTMHSPLIHHVNLPISMDLIRMWLFTHPEFYYVFIHISGHPSVSWKFDIEITPKVDSTADFH